MSRFSLQPSPGTPTGVTQGSGAGSFPLEALIRADQLAAVRRSVMISIPVNAMLGICNLLMALRYGPAELGIAWFAVSSLVNLVRIWWCRTPFVHPREAVTEMAKEAASARVEKQLRVAWMLAALSGLVWAGVPLLSAGYTSPQASFFLIVVCGICAGAVVHGTAYAPVPAAFITPALLSVAGCLIYAGGWDNNFLAFTVLLYLAALLRSTVQSQGVFRDASRLKNEATGMARSMQEAHARASSVAEEMSHRATHDALTGLLNRDGFMREATRRLAGAPDALCLLLDIDGFKAVNDMYGHRAGDNLLVEAAERLRGQLPDQTAIGRMGGDEFAILVDPGRLGETPEHLADQLIAAIGRPFPGCENLRVSASVGIHRRREEDVTALLLAADAALDAAKASGRGRRYLFDEALRQRLQRLRDAEHGLLRALNEGPVQLWFQPQMDRGGRHLAGFEALIRWPHPQHGWISPPEIITAAATAGLSEALLRFVLREACDMAAVLRDMGLGHLCVAMNVSPHDVTQFPLDELVARALRQRDLNPSMLELEITEEAVMDLKAVQGKLSRLAGSGVRLAIDDFGVGYSSLAALRQIRAHRLKVDRSFISGIGESPDNQALLRTILSLGDSLGVQVVAEGVETEEDVQMLRELGCPAMQGYYLGCPMSRQEALNWLRHTEGVS